MKFTLRFSAFRTSLLFAFILGLGLFSLTSIFDGDGLRLDSALLPFRIEGSGEELGESRRRENWLYFQRAYPAETIPVEAGMRMIEQLEREEARMRELRARAGNEAEAPDQQLVWVSIGPQPILGGFSFGSPQTNASGRVSAIALDPRYDGANNQTVYVGGAQGGVWKSTDNGANWTPLTDGQTSSAIGAIAVDPNNPNVIYAGTGESNDCGLCYYGAGLLKSTDGGSTWTQITGPATSAGVPAFLNVGFTKITIDPTNSSVVYAATGAAFIGNANSFPQRVSATTVGLWKSTDGGSTWRNLDPSSSNSTTRCHDVIVDPQNNNRVYAAMRLTGVFRSNSGGEPGTWTRLTGGLPEPASTPANSSFVRIILASGPPIAPSTTTTLYAAYAGRDDNLFGIWRSTDGGDNWVRVTTPQLPGQANYNLDLTVDPADGRIVYYGTAANEPYNGGTLLRSRDAGGTWADLSLGDGQSGGLHPDTHQIVVAPANRNILFTGNDGGVWRTNNATSDTVSWAQLNNTLSITQFMSVALHPTDANILIGGTQDNGTLRYQGNVGWDFVDGSDGGFTLIDQSNPQVMYHTYFNVNNQDSGGALIGPLVSLTGGGLGSWRFRGCNSCTAREGGFNPSDRVAFYAPMALNTGFTGANGNVVYFGTHRLYRSSNRGSAWIGLGASVDNFGADLTAGQGVITAIAAHPAPGGGNPPGEIVWAGTSDGQVQVTINAGALAGANFSNLTKAPLPNRFVSDIALYPNDTQRAVVIFSGFNSNTPSTPGHVFLTTNQGTAWQNISGNLPDVPVSSVALNPANPNTIYIGTDLGVFQTTNGGTTWERLSVGMPRVAVFMVRYHAASNSVIAATHGRGVFRLTAARAVTTVSAANFSASSITSEAIVAAFGTGLATRTESATALPLPTALAGTRVTVRDSAGVERLAPLFFVAPQQVNFQVPAGTAAGAATVTITSGDGSVSSGATQVASVAPSLFAANANGKDVAAGSALRVRADNSRENVPINRFDQAQSRFVSVPIDLGPSTDQLFLTVYGTGLRFRSSLSGVTATIGGVNSEVLFAGPQGVFVGLDQVNLRIPRALAGRGEVDVALTVDGKTANALKVNIK